MKRELTNQELLGRYVYSVKALLPPDKRDDIAAEISSNLQSLVEDRAMQLKRELNLDEVSAIVKQHGHPMVVASRYRDRPSWGLSPELFRLYWPTLRTILGLVFAFRVIGAVFAIQRTAAVGPILVSLVRDILLVGFFIAAGVTAVFAVWEYLEFKFRFGERWRPESLPPVPPAIRHPRPAQPGPMGKIIGGVASLFFLAIAMFWPAMFWVWGRTGVFSPSATVYAMRLPLLLLVLCWITQGWLDFTRFAAAEWRPFLRIAVTIAGLVLAFLLLRQGDLLVAGPNWDPAQGSSLASMNRFFAGVLVLSCIGSGLACARELRRILGNTARRAGEGQTANSAF